MNERYQIQREDESNSAAESSPKSAIDQLAEPPGSALKIQSTGLLSDRSTKASDNAPESAIISAGSPDDPNGAQANARGESRQDATMEETVTIEHKHSLAIRWMHWINFPLLALMIYSGLLIYWADSQHEGLNAHRVYRVGFGSWTLFRVFPPWLYNNFHLNFQLAKALGTHFFFMWLFALNAISYVLHIFFSGELRELVPTRR